MPVGREIATATFTSTSGWPWRWDGGRTPLQVIGSYTRSCRCVIDPSRPGHSGVARPAHEAAVLPMP